MDINSKVIEDVENFLKEWQAGNGSMKECFANLLAYVRDMDEVTLDFVSRPGVSYSLRPKHVRQTDRELFAILDVIDDNPEERWLSVCFYGDMISDPEERGEVIPGGLAGNDGYCFDMDVADAAFTSYLKERLLEACKAASA